ncbi:MAG: ureidoglycolate lyase [Rhizobacter sp.]
MSTTRHVVTIEPLSAEAFRLFGDVIERASSARHFTINQGYAERYDDLAQIDVSREAGYPRLSIFRAKPRSLPFALTLLERHPLGSQAFVPMSALPYLVVVSLGGDTPALASIRCFRAAPGQGVNYAPGTWHHPLLALHQSCDFAVVDRGGPEHIGNCDEVALPAGAFWIEA